MSERRRTPLDRLVGLVPVDAVVQRIDVDELLDRVDVNALLDRIDLDRVVDRLDVDRIVAKVDVDALVARLDLERLVERSVRAATRGTLAAARERFARADAWVGRVTDRLLRRARGAGARRETAGPVTRLAAYAFDMLASTALLALTTVAVVVGVALFSGETIRLQVDSVIGIPATALFEFLYFFVSWAAAGKSPGLALLGLRVVRRDGTALGAPRAALRALVFPLSFVAGLGLVGVVIGREHRALHDVVADTVVVYD